MRKSSCVRFFLNGCCEIVCCFGSVSPHVVTFWDERWRTLQNIFYVFYRIISIVLAIPRNILWGIKQFFTMYLAIIVIGILLWMALYVFKLYCSEIALFLDFLFLDGDFSSGGGIIPFLRTGASVETLAKNTWNRSVVPILSPSIVLSIDTLISMYRTLELKFSDIEIEILFFRMISKYDVMCEMIFDSISRMALLEREELVRFHENWKILIEQLVSTSPTNFSSLLQWIFIHQQTWKSVLLPTLVAMSSLHTVPSLPTENLYVNFAMMNDVTRDDGNSTKWLYEFSENENENIHPFEMLVKSNDNDDSDDAYPRKEYIHEGKRVLQETNHGVGFKDNTTVISPKANSVMHSQRKLLQWDNNTSTGKVSITRNSNMKTKNPLMEDPYNDLATHQTINNIKTKHNPTIESFHRQQETTYNENNLNHRQEYLGKEQEETTPNSPLLLTSIWMEMITRNILEYNTLEENNFIEEEEEDISFSLSNRSNRVNSTSTHIRRKRVSPFSKQEKENRIRFYEWMGVKTSRNRHRDLLEEEDSHTPMISEFVSWFIDRFRNGQGFLFSLHPHKIFETSITSDFIEEGQSPIIEFWNKVVSVPRNTQDSSSSSMSTKSPMNSSNSFHNAQSREGKGQQKRRRKSKSSDRMPLHFSDYLEDLDITPLQVSSSPAYYFSKMRDYANEKGRHRDMKRSPSSSSSSSMSESSRRVSFIHQTHRSGHQRKLQQLLPSIGILDCFADVPPDPLCILGNILPVPFTPPFWLEPFLGYECECEEYDDDGDFCIGVHWSDYKNAHLVFKSLLSLLSSIEYFGISDFFLSFEDNVPEFVEDVFFIESPGKRPSNNKIVCAILHSTCVIFLFIILLVVYVILSVFLRVIAEVLRAWQDIRIFREHCEMYRETIGKEQRRQDFDKNLLQHLNYEYTVFTAGPPQHHQNNVHTEESSTKNNSSSWKRPIHHTKTSFENHNSTSSLYHPLSIGRDIDSINLQEDYQIHKKTPTLSPNTMPHGSEKKVGNSRHPPISNNHIIHSKMVFDAIDKCLLLNNDNDVDDNGLDENSTTLRICNEYEIPIYTDNRSKHRSKDNTNCNVQYTKEKQHTREMGTNESLLREQEAMRFYFLLHAEDVLFPISSQNGSAKKSPQCKKYKSTMNSIQDKEDDHDLIFDAMFYSMYFIMGTPSSSKYSCMQGDNKKSIYTESFYQWGHPHEIEKNNRKSPSPPLNLYDMMLWRTCSPSLYDHWNELYMLPSYYEPNTFWEFVRSGGLSIL